MSVDPLARHKGIAQVTLPGVARESALRRGRALPPEPSCAGGTLHPPGRNAREFPSLVEAASGQSRGRQRHGDQQCLRITARQHGVTKAFAEFARQWQRAVVFQTNHERIERSYVICKSDCGVKSEWPPQTGAANHSVGAANCRTFREQVATVLRPCRRHRHCAPLAASRRLCPVRVERHGASCAELPRCPHLTNRAVVGQGDPQQPLCEAAKRGKGVAEDGQGGSDDDVAEAGAEQQPADSLPGVQKQRQ